MIPERLADECAQCRAVIYVHFTGLGLTENFCALCSIERHLETIVEILSDVVDP